jgi:hypothetical protein
MNHAPQDPFINAQHLTRIVTATLFTHRTSNAKGCEIGRRERLFDLQPPHLHATLLHAAKRREKSALDFC